MIISLNNNVRNIATFPTRALYAIEKEKPPHVQAHFILFVPHKTKRAFTSPPPPEIS